MNARQQTILQLVVDRSRAGVAELAKATGVSEVTIRHDLTLLEQQSYLRRAHGYAVPINGDDVETRMMNHYPLKRQLAIAAARMVHDGETVFIENGSSNALLARELAEHKRVTIITVSSYIAHLLKETDCEVILLGGVYQKKSESMVGPLTRHCIGQVHFSKAFIGIDGWKPNTGFTGRDMMRTDIVNAVLEKESEVIILTDSSKFGVTHPYPFSADARISFVITDNRLDGNIQTALEYQTLRLTIVNGDS